MKALFNKKKKLLKQLNDVGYLLDEQINIRWGFHYSQTDSDPIIDTLDYGTSNIDYKEFVERMDDFKSRQEKGDWTPNH
jgi:hypothetical protein